MREETWYAVHVYSGYEQKIQKQLERMIQTNELLSQVCHGVRVPMKTITETKDGKEKTRKVKLMPGYILVDVDFPPYDGNEERYKGIVSAIRNINGVTGFVTPTSAKGSMPIPLTRGEMNRIKENTGEIKVDRSLHDFQDFQEGDEISIISGPFAGFDGVVQEDLVMHKKLKVQIEIFSRPTSVQVEKKDVEKKKL
ncbi:MAG TPA: transcription termination/antitermination protein NusG [Spirochaetaceae bacterium]|nr:transcription termination/antitermination protein NusG [Spirochaetaceae bacterium]